jgi:hypothetical protein
MNIVLGAVVIVAAAVAVAAIATFPVSVSD